jgi:hypothetical protein
LVETRAYTAILVPASAVIVRYLYP